MIRRIVAGATLFCVAVAAWTLPATAADGGRAYPPSPVALGGGWTVQWDTAVNADGAPAQRERYGGVAFLKNGRLQWMVPFDDLFPDIMQPRTAKAYRLDARSSLRAVALLPQHGVNQVQVTFDRCAPQCRAAVAYIAIRNKPVTIRHAGEVGANGAPLDSVFRIAGSRAMPDGGRLVYGSNDPTCGTDLIEIDSHANVSARVGDYLAVYGSWATRSSMSVEERAISPTAARGLCRSQR
jgi:hypothetical protein